MIRRSMLIVAAAAIADRMIKRSTSRVAAAGILACAGLFGAAQASSARMVGLGGSRSGPSASIRNDSGIGYFAVTHDSASLEIAAGNVNDKVFGTSAITYALKLGSGSTAGTVSITAKPVVLYTAKGSLSGTATATIDNLTSTTQKITNGKLKLTKGAGSLKGDELTATFSGTADLSKNQFVFTYQGQLQS
jgi:hypothetical protein